MVKNSKSLGVSGVAAMMPCLPACEWDHGRVSGMQEQELRDPDAQFRDQNIQAFAGRHFEIAYHAFAAAILFAGDIRDAGLLAEVQRLAEEQGQWIDTNAPEHKLSSRNAKTQGNESIFLSRSK